MLCKVMYTRTRDEPGGAGWATDYPYAVHNLMLRLSERTRAPVSRPGPPLLLFWWWAGWS